ncbi:MAG: hypothetical protein AAF333_04385 [Planctomycetota bacterium]
MALELCYTSSPQGLLPGTHGYCTVAASEQLTQPVMQRLEALSGYRPMYNVGDVHASRNPVAVSHLRLSIDGETRSVLSRIAYVGADYSGRINKFAYHLLLEQNELAAAGPAWLLTQPDLMRHGWPDPPRRIAAPRAVPSGDMAPQVCRRWEDATGDAGWAGNLIEFHLLDPAKPTYILYDPRQHDALALTAEALALLPASRRWQVSFSTYFTDPTGDAGCGWRWVARGTPMAERIAGREVAGHAIDLTQPLGEAQDSRYVRAARHGKTPTDHRGSDAATPAVAQTAPTPTESQSDPAQVATAIPLQTTSTDAESNVRVSRPEPPRIPTGYGTGALIAAAITGALIGLGGFYLLRPPQPAAADLATAVKPQQLATLEEDLAESRAYVASLEQRIAILTERPDAIERTVRPPQASGPVPDSPSVVDGPLMASKITAAKDIEVIPVRRTASTEIAPAPTPAIGATDLSKGVLPAERVYAELRAPALEGQGSAGLGTLSRLAEHEQVLWAAKGLKTGAVVRVASPSVDTDAPLQWVQDTGAASIVHTTHDSLGIAHHQVLGTARLELRGLVWRWHPAPFQPGGITSGEALSELHSLAKYAVLTVVDEGGRTIKQVQPSAPRHVETPAGVSVPSFIPGVAKLTPKIVLEAAPTGWQLHPVVEQSPTVLRGPRGAELLLKLIPATEKFETQWSSVAEPRALSLRLSRAVSRYRELGDLLKHHDRLEDDVADAYARLPRRADGETIDHEGRSRERWRVAFIEYDKARDERDKFSAEVAPEGIDLIAQEYRELARQIENDRARQQDVDSFDHAELRVVASHSGADVAILKLTRESP